MKILHFTKNSPEWLQAREGLITGTKNKELISTKGISKELLMKTLTEQEIPFKKTDTIENLKSLLAPSVLSKLETETRKSSIPTLKGFYRLIADRLTVEKPKNDFLPEDYELKEDARARGHRLESEAVQKFREMMHNLIINDDCTLCVSEENDKLGYSPDGLIYEKEEKMVEAKHFEIGGYVPVQQPIATIEVKCLDGANHIEALITQDYSDFEWQLIQGFIVNPKQQYAYLVYYNPDLKLPLHWIHITRESVKEKITQLQEIQALTLTEVEDWTNKILNNEI